MCTWLASENVPISLYFRDIWFSELAKSAIETWLDESCLCFLRIVLSLWIYCFLISSNVNSSFTFLHSSKVSSSTCVSTSSLQIRSMLLGSFLLDINWTLNSVTLYMAGKITQLCFKTLFGDRELWTENIWKTGCNPTYNFFVTRPHFSSTKTAFVDHDFSSFGLF